MPEKSKVLMTIRETARTQIAPEYLLRRWEKEGKLPCVYSGKRCLINYPMLVEFVNHASMEGAVKE